MHNTPLIFCLWKCRRNRFFNACKAVYSGSVVKTKIQAFYNEPIYVAELGGASIKQHDQSAVPDNNMMRVSDC